VRKWVLQLPEQRWESTERIAIADVVVELNPYQEAYLLTLERLGVPSVTGAEGLGLPGLDGLVHGLVHPLVDQADQDE
jgi:hypothetical protein